MSTQDGGLTVAEPSERELVEAARLLEVGDAYREVVEDVEHVGRCVSAGARATGGRFVEWTVEVVNHNC